MAVISINGKIKTRKQAKISVYDHGFLYGDSVYETIRTYDSRPFLFSGHLRRLQHSCQSIQVALPWDEERFALEVEKLTRRTRARNHLIRIIITRGEGKIGYTLCSEQQPNIVIIVDRFRGFASRLYKTGITLITSHIRRNPAACLDPAIKSSNLQALRLAYVEAAEKGGNEALILTLNGEIAECSSSSIFFVKNGQLFTPSLDTGILHGITREFVIDLARGLHIPVKEARLQSVMLDVCEECFITSTIKSVLPVRQIDNKQVGEPGPVTTRLMKAFRDALEHGAPHQR